MAELFTLGETMMNFAPDHPGPLRYNRSYTSYIAGAESNTAIGLCKLGHSAEWFSSLGEDEPGQYIENMIRAEGVLTHNVKRDPSHPTGVMIKEFTTAQETKVFYYRSSSAFSHLCPEDFQDSLLDQAKIFHFTGITPILSDSCKETARKAVSIARKRKIPVSFDPNIRRKLWKDHDYTQLMKEFIFASTFVFIGKEEAECLFSVSQPDKLRDLIFSKSDVSYLAFKDGGRGAYVYSKDEGYQIPPFPCTCVDPIGAGDAFNSGFLAGYLEGKDLYTCGQYAGICGALCTQTTGDIEGFPDRRTLQNILGSKEEIFR